jgi:pimeloyl-ACP methyl ester carboxylesterase
MSRLRAFSRGAGIAGVAAAGAAGVAYGAQRIAVARVRANADDTPDVFDPIPLAAHEIPSHDGGTISYVDSGPATHPATFVLSHGVTLSVRTWVRQLTALPAAGHRTIAFDHRGHGGSQLGATEFSVDNLGDDLCSLLETLDLHDTVLVGHSMGGIALQSFVARHPAVAASRVRGIVLLNTFAVAPGGSQAARFNHLAERLTRRTPDSTWLWSNPELGVLLARFGFGRSPAPSHLELVRQMMLACPAHTRLHAPRSLIGVDFTETLERIEIPTLIIGGTADMITPISASRGMHRRIRGSRLEELDGGGHMLMLERTAAVNALLCEFAASVTGEAILP